MRRRTHTTTVILFLLAAGSARADFSAAWQDYFATERIAAESYSGSVERCRAVGVTPNEPSWWDYWIGKNHAKLVSVKANIKATYAYFINPQLADGSKSYISYLATGDVARLTWTNEAQFLSDIGLPANALDETPWFKLQYPGTTGGWHTARICLSNMVVTKAVVDWHPNVWTNLWMPREEIVGESSNWFSSLPIVSALGGFRGIGPTRLLDIYPTWEFTPYYGADYVAPGVGNPPLPLVCYFLENESYFENARGVWTAHGDETTWATNWDLATDGWVKSLTYGAGDWPTPPPQADYGMDWQRSFSKYMVKDRPKALLGGVCVVHSNETVSVITNEYVYAVTNYTGTNTVYEYDYEHWSVTVTVTNVETNAVFRQETNGYADVTNSVSVTTTNFTAITNWGMAPDTSVYGRHSITSSAGFGTEFIGTRWYETNVMYMYTAAVTNDYVVTTVTNAVVTNMPVITNVFDHTDYQTNVVEEEHGFTGTNLVIVATNYVPDTNTAVITIETNLVEEGVTNYAEVSYFAAGATEINAFPYAGTTPYYLTKGFSGDIEPVYPGTNLYGMTPLWTGVTHTVDFYYQWITPTNFPPTVPTWHGYNESFAGSGLTVVSHYNDFDGGTTQTWARQAGAECASDIVWGDIVYGSAFDTGSSLEDASMAAMKTVYDADFSTAPNGNEINIVGRELTNDFAAVWWKFNWK